MFTPFVRLVILLFLALVSIIMALQGKLFPLILSSLLSLYILWDYVIHGTIPLAYRRLLNHDFTAAERAIDYVQKPEKLSNAMSAKYYAVKGMIAHHKDDFENAGHWLEVSLTFPQSDKKLRIMTLLTLTDIALIQKKNRKAKDFFNQLDGMHIPKKLEPTLLKLEEHLNQL